MNGSFSSKQKLNLGVPQGSVLGPLLFNIYLNDLLISVDDIEICNYADDTTLYSCDQNLQNVVERLENVSLKVIKWFSDSCLKLNEDKCHFLALGASRDEPVTIKIGNASVQNSTQEKLLGVTIDNKLTFEHHVAGLCQKASNKLYALSRIAPFMDQGKLRYLMRAFINSQFQYCPLAWMFHSRELRHKIDKIQERALRVTYQDYESSFEVLMEKDRSITVHQRNLQNLMTEMYKTKNGLNPAFMREIFCQQESQHNLRNSNDFSLPRIKTVTYGSETIRFRGPQVWATVPQFSKDSASLTEFKNKIKSWSGESCHCRLCQTFVPNLGFI